MPLDSAISRRRFGQLSATLAAGGLLHLHAQAPATPQVAPAANDLDARVQWKTDRVLAEFGSRLDDAQKARMRTIIAGHERMLSTVMAFPLSNGDTPATVLRVEVRDGQ